MTTAVHRISISLPELEQLAQKILLTLAWPVWDEPLPWCQQAFPVLEATFNASNPILVTHPSFCSHDHSPDRALFSQIRLFARSHARGCDGPDSGAEPQSCPPAPCGMDTVAHGCFSRVTVMGSVLFLTPVHRASRKMFVSTFPKRLLLVFF